MIEHRICNTNAVRANQTIVDVNLLIKYKLLAFIYERFTVLTADRKYSLKNLAESKFHENQIFILFL